MKPTQQLHEAGQSLWLDNNTRSLLDTGWGTNFVVTVAFSAAVSDEIR